MTKLWKAHELRRLRTMIAFAYGDSCHGGPPHTEEIATLKKELRELEATPTDDDNPVA